jgi:alpha-galactosidase
VIWRHRIRSFLLIAAVAMLALPAFAARASEQLPDPDGKPADLSKPVQVFILMGQSNMLGFGRIAPVDQQGTLEYLTKKEGKYPHLVDDEGNWTERQDVRNVHVMDTRGAGLTEFTKFQDMKNEWLTVSGRHIGPELQFGHIMGHVHDAPVLILKACIGNRSLGWDLLPPGSQRFEFDGKIYAGYKDNPLSWVEGEPKKEVNWYAGRQYDADTGHAKEALKNLEKYYPTYQGQGYEIAGFVFWQGHKDQNPAHASRYEQNLVHFIKTLRKDFNAPDAKFVLATIAFGGWELDGPGLTIANAQLAVDGDKGKYPEFKGNVKAVETRDFWRDKEVSPSGAGYHYNHNAETYMEVGNALGWAMADLLKKTGLPQ